MHTLGLALIAFGWSAGMASMAFMAAARRRAIHRQIGGGR